jgi:superfamily I DNA and/or RNA helicase
MQFTVDAYQGREKKVIILSCVRVADGFSKDPIAFISNDRRVNVALTRAIACLIVIGHRETLQQGMGERDPVWKAWLQSSGG